MLKALLLVLFMINGFAGSSFSDNIIGENNRGKEAVGFSVQFNGMQNQQSESPEININPLLVLGVGYGLFVFICILIYVMILRWAFKINHIVGYLDMLTEQMDMILQRLHDIQKNS